MKYIPKKRIARKKCPGKLHICYMKTFMFHIKMLKQIHVLAEIIGATEFCSSGQVSNSDDVTDFHIHYEQIPTKDAKSKHDVPS